MPLSDLERVTRPADLPLRQQVRPFEETHSVFTVLRETFWPALAAAERKANE